jgi:hypothetical protein
VAERFGDPRNQSRQALQAHSDDTGLRVAGTEDKNWCGFLGKRALLQKLGDYIAEALDHAASADERAARESDAGIRSGYEQLAAGWRRVAHYFEFIRTVDQFLADSHWYRRPEPIPDLTSEQCRKRAAECQRKAAVSADPLSMEQYEQLAREWSELADEIESRTRLS